MRAIVLLITFVTCLSLPALAADDIATAQGVITAQEQALARDDAAAAFGLASPALQEIFQAPELFIAMVMKSYAPVYRHKRFDFGKAEIVDGKVAQIVNIVDADGEFWEALYLLEPQSDSSFRIIGCTLKKTMGA